MRSVTGTAALGALAACHSEPAPALATIPTPVSVAPTPMPSAEPAIDLRAYVGKYPPDKIAGVGFLDQPVVRAAVAEAVPDPRVRAWILEKAGPQTPIAWVDSRILSWGCQAHMCGPHNWTILLAPDGSNAEVCYIDMDTMKRPTWYVAGKAEPRDAPCPTGDED